MPFGQKCEFPDFDACVKKMTGKVEEPKAYCAVLMRRTEDHCKGLEDALMENGIELTIAQVKELCPSCAEKMEFRNLRSLSVTREWFAEQKLDPEKVCGNIWFNGSEKQRESFAGGTQGRGRNEKPPKEWWDDCMGKVGKAVPISKMGDLERWQREEDLKDLEAYRVGVAEAPMFYKALGHIVDKVGAAPDAPTIFVASEESEDRMGDLISIDGWQLEEYMKNPVYLYAHDRLIPPIGIVPKVWKEGKQLLNHVRWDDKDEFAQKIKGKYERRIMRGQSVGFKALEFEERKDKKAGIFFKQAELVEISAVAVPANPNALAKGLHAMLGRPFFLDMLDLPNPAFEKALTKASKSKLEQAMNLIKEVVEGPSPTEPATPEAEKQVLDNETAARILKNAFKE